jgi:hypothetical protein
MLHVGKEMKAAPQERSRQPGQKHERNEASEAQIKQKSSHPSSSEGCHGTVVPSA